MAYSAGYGAWKTIKDGAATTLSLLVAGSIAAAVQAEAQCPELTFTAFGLTIGIKAIVQFLNNYRKNA